MIRRKCKFCGVEFDSDGCETLCETCALKNQMYRARKLSKTWFFVAVCTLCICAAAFACFDKFVIPIKISNSAKNQEKLGNFQTAMYLYSENGHEESARLKLKLAEKLINERKYEEALLICDAIGSGENVRNIKCSIAEHLMDEGEYNDAIQCLKSISEVYCYFDKGFHLDLRRSEANKLLRECYKLRYGEDYYDIMISDSICIGDVFYIGDFTEDGKEPIVMRWLVVDKIGENVVLMSTESVGLYGYHNNNESVSWQHSEIREWLNGYFLSHTIEDMHDQDEVPISQYLTPFITVNNSGESIVDYVTLPTMSDMKKYSNVYGLNFDFEKLNSGDSSYETLIRGNSLTQDPSTLSNDTWFRLRSDGLELNAPVYFGGEIRYMNHTYQVPVYPMIKISIY